MKTFTRRETKERLRFIAEWWSPSVLTVASPPHWPETPESGCILQVAAEWVGTPSPRRLAHRLGLKRSEALAISTAWDRRDSTGVLEIIEAL